MFIKFQVIMLLVGWLLVVLVMVFIVINDGSGSNIYMFIDNDVDDEYFIIISFLFLCFIGVNIWMKYKMNQCSLGYMGNLGWSYSNCYFDFWIDNFLIN